MAIMDDHPSTINQQVVDGNHSGLLYRLRAQEATWPQIWPAERGGDRVETSTGPKL